MDLFPKLSQIFEGNGRLARFIPQPEASLSVTPGHVITYIPGGTDSDGIYGVLLLEEFGVT